MTMSSPRNIRRWAAYAGLALIGLVLGSGFAIYRLQDRNIGVAIKNRAWSTFDGDANKTDWLTMGRLAIHAILVLGKTETIYFSAGADDQGHPLSSDHVYRIHGIPPSARYWSITVYDLHSDLVANESNRYNLNGETIHLGSDGLYTIYLSQKSRDENWLPAGNVGPIYLTFRLYMPSEELRRSLTTTQELPTIEEANP
jgi:hypothetical protein